MLMIFYCFMELYIFATTGEFLGRTRSKCIWLLAFILVLVATVFWWSSQTGRMMCDPNSFWQIHGLVWHPLLNIAMVLLYLYWRDIGKVPIESEEVETTERREKRPISF